MPPAILPPTSENIRFAAEALQRGELVGMPTETVYGLAGDALNPAALAAIFEVKQRPFFDPLIVHIADITWVGNLCAQIPNQARVLMEKFWPGPLTLALPKKKEVPDLATSGLSTVAVRMPAHPVALALLRAAGIPLAAPSANPFGQLSPTNAQHVAQDFEAGLACILDGGPCSVGVESTIIGWDQKANPILLRPGGISREEIQNALGVTLTTLNSAVAPQAPGNLPSHYAPHTPLFIWSETSKLEANKRFGLLWSGPETIPNGFIIVENISPSDNLTEAAVNLFSALHRLDEKDLDGIYARLVADSGLGLAINDRLQKAAVK